VSVRRKMLAGAAAAMLAGGTAMAALPGASAATVACGSTCISPYTEAFGVDYVLGVYQGSQTTGQPAVLSVASNVSNAEDWAYSAEGTVSDFYAASLVSSAVNLHYGSDEAYEFEYAPGGSPSGLCLGVGATAGSNSKVGLQVCGASSRTIWIEDGTDYDGTGAPLINGSDTNFSQPYVLTYPAGKSPVSAPNTQLITYNLQQTTNGINPSQMWGFEVGVLSQGG
jgi:hypothetical protein